MSSEHFYNHQGLFLKKYIIDNKINRKGRLKPLIEKLDLSRQGFYKLYEAQVLKEKYQKVIIGYFDLPKNFFPIVAYPDSKELSRLKVKYAKLEKALEAEKRKNIRLKSKISTYK